MKFLITPQTLFDFEHFATFTEVRSTCIRFFKIGILNQVMSAVNSSTTSVSKGCFVIRPKKIRQRINEEKLYRLTGESKEHCQLRHEIFQKTWCIVDDQVNLLHTSLNEDVFASIMEFIVGNKFHNFKVCPYLILFRSLQYAELRNYNCLFFNLYSFQNKQLD